MDISLNMLFIFRIITPSLMILAIVAVYSKRWSLSKLKSSTIVLSTLILNSAVQLPGRSLSGKDGLIIVLNFVVIILGLSGILRLLWRNESKNTQGVERT